LSIFKIFKKLSREHICSIGEISPNLVTLLMVIGLNPGANPTTLSYNAMSSLLRFENKDIISALKTL
jgi:hypothetical protein